MIRWLCALCALMLCAPSCASEDVLTGAMERGELIRLHVVADSDDPQDQAVKLEVRDAVLDEAREILAGCESADEAWQMLEDRVDDFEDAARERLKELGCEQDASAALGWFDFPDREYSGVKVPAGTYRALRVTLGSGQGANWWCVLYPTLCFSGEGEPRSVIWDFLKDHLGGILE